MSFQNTMSSFRANGSAVAEKNGKKQTNKQTNIEKLGVQPVKNGRSMRFYHPWLAARSPSVHWHQIPRCLTSDKAEDKAFMNVKPNHCHVTVAVPKLILAQYNALRICDNSLNTRWCPFNALVKWTPKWLAVFPISFQNTVSNFRANGSAVAEKNGNIQTNTHWEI